MPLPRNNCNKKSLKLVADAQAIHVYMKLLFLVLGYLFHSQDIGVDLSTKQAL